MQQVSKITVFNQGGYVFGFSVQWLTPDGEWHTSEWNSGNYPVGQNRTTPELSELGVPADAIAVTPYGHAVAGRSGQGHAFVTYTPNANAVASYNAVGTTIIGFDIVLVQ